MSDKTTRNECCGTPFQTMETAPLAGTFQGLLNDAPMGIFRTSIHGKLLYANRTLLNILGYPSIEELNRSIPSIAAIYQDPQDRLTITEMLLTGQEIQEFRFAIRQRNGNPVTLNMWAHSIKSADGIPCYFQGFIQDVTARAQTSDALATCEQRYQALVNASPLGIYQTTRDGTFLSVNPALARILGYDSVQELLLKVPNASVLYPNPEVRERIILRDIPKSAPYTFDTVLLRKDGTPIMVRIHGRFVQDATGEVVRLDGFLEDISDSLRTRMSLQQSEERFRSLVESIQEGFWEVDREAKYTYVSPKFCEMLGYSREELLGITPFQLMPEDEARKVRLLFEPAATARKPFSYLENWNLRKDGSRILLETSGGPYFDAEGRFCGYRGIDRDITEHKTAELKFRRSKQELERLIEQRNRELKQARIDLKQQQQQVSLQQKALDKLNRDLLETNRAVTLMARRVERSRSEVTKQIAFEIRTKIMPLVAGLRGSGLPESCQPELKMLVTYLKDIGSSLGTPVDLLQNVTPAELRVATMIKDGMISKDIAEQLNVTLTTVKSHRKNLRRKLKIKDSGIDLRKFLQAKLP